MTLIESILLALALCVDSLAVSTASAFRSKMSCRKGIEMALVFALFQGAFPLLGALLGGAFKDLIASIDHWVAFVLLLIVGGKMIIDAFRPDDDSKALDVTRFSVMCLLGVATSIDAFVVGIGFGLNSTLAQVLLTVAIITVVTFMVSVVGWFLGKRNIPIPEKWASIIAGIVLIALGTHTLIEHLFL